MLRRHQAPPPYIRTLLGSRPESLTRRASWDRTVRRIERYGARHGIDDPDRALGPVPRNALQRVGHAGAVRDVERYAEERGQGTAQGQSHC